jgi:hypothetical protein
LSFLFLYYFFSAANAGSLKTTGMIWVDHARSVEGDER